MSIQGRLPITGENLFREWLANLPEHPWTSWVNMTVGERYAWDKLAAEVNARLDDEIAEVLDV